MAEADTGGGGAERAASRAALAEELRRLGRGMRIPDVDGESMAERVLAQLLAEPVPVPVPEPPRRAARIRHWLRGRWRRLAAVFSGLLVVLFLTPPVRAAVVDWFDFGGVEVRYTPSASPLPSASVPGCRPGLSLAEAGRRAGFAPRVPAALGAPDAVSLSGRAGRSVVSLCWNVEGRTVRLDEFRATLEIGFVKQARIMPQWVPLTRSDGVALQTGLWFEDPHLLRFRLIGSAGGGWTESVRTAGPTLLWEDPGPGPRPDEDPAGAGGNGVLTMRLEGIPEAARAKAVAEAVR